MRTITKLNIVLAAAAMSGAFSSFNFPRQPAEKQPDPERQAKAALKRDRCCQRNLKIQAAGGFK